MGRRKKSCSFITSVSGALAWSLAWAGQAWSDALCPKEEGRLTHLIGGCVHLKHPLHEALEHLWEVVGCAAVQIALAGGAL